MHTRTRGGSRPMVRPRRGRCARGPVAIDRWPAPALYVLLLALAACGSDPRTPVASEDLERLGADQILFGMTHYITKDGVREGLLEADTAYFYRDSSFVSLRSLRLTVYTEAGQERAVVTSRSGTLDERTDLMVARGEVVLVVRDGDRTIESEELHYDPNGDRIWSDSATVMRQGNQVTRGTAFQSDLEFRNVRIQNARTTGGVIRF